jgi:hypothetical protein
MGEAKVNLKTRQIKVFHKFDRRGICMKTTSKNKLMKLLGAISTIAFLAGCPSGGGSGSVNLSVAPSTDNPQGISVTLEKINSVALADLGTRVDGLGQLWSKDTTITFEGNCSLGVAKILITIDGTPSGTLGTCDSNGRFSWTNTFASGTPANGTNYVIVAKPATANGVAFTNLNDNQFVTKTVVVDDQAPSAVSSVVVTAPSGLAAVFTSGSWLLRDSLAIKPYDGTATAPSDAISVSGMSTFGTTAGGAAQTFSSSLNTATGVISFSGSISIGSQNSVTLKVLDRAGNESLDLITYLNYQSALASNAERYMSTSSYAIVTSGVSVMSAEIGLGSSFITPGGPSPDMYLSTAGVIEALIP